MCWCVTVSQIYKSTKCNDMQQCGSCPRGPFCAFAHVESKSSQFISKHLSTTVWWFILQLHILFVFRALCSRGAIIPHTKLPSTPQTSRPSSCPGSFFKSQQTQHGAWFRFCFRPLLPICGVMCGGAGTAGQRFVSVWRREWRSRASISLGRRGRVRQSAWIWEGGSGEKDRQRATWTWSDTIKWNKIFESL